MSGGEPGFRDLAVIFGRKHVEGWQAGCGWQGVGYRVQMERGRWKDGRWLNRASEEALQGRTRGEDRSVDAEMERYSMNRGESQSGGIQVSR